MKRSPHPTVCVAMLILVGGAVADTLSVPLGTVAYISGSIRGGTRGRILVRPEIPDQITNGRIDFAMLIFPAVRLPESLSLVTVEARQITTDWNPANVSWTTPWRSPGGDYDTLCQSLFTIIAGDSVSPVLDVTKIVRGWQSGDQYGLILKRPGYEDGGFRGEGVLLRTAARSGRLKVWYRNAQD